jgi:hypothetical protein
MPALIPVRATDGCDCIFKTKENIVIEFKGGLTSDSQWPCLSYHSVK